MAGPVASLQENQRTAVIGVTPVAPARRQTSFETEPATTQAQLECS
ncbi:hypothetical protein [Halocatena salina]|uniref:Uncharacterized protein n=1 Tax=Halocatena salina TaxID=2934340 RepID=A0A8U0AAL8_9EURY|nr:hypothetical protein [Halocatena salina]UPM44847.1 hypothetical protein MW046_15780 [Halocatena salina]